MTRDERWNQMWDAVMLFLKENKWRPSKYKPEEHDLRNWVKYNVKRMRSGQMPANRLERMQQLLDEGERLRRVNQHVYTHPETQSLIDTPNT